MRTAPITQVQSSHCLQQVEVPVSCRHSWAGYLDGAAFRDALSHTPSGALHTFPADVGEMKAKPHCPTSPLYSLGNNYYDSPFSNLISIN